MIIFIVQSLAICRLGMYELEGERHRTNTSTKEYAMESIK